MTNESTPPQKGNEEEFPIEFKLLLAVIAVSVIVAVLSLSGVI